MNLRLLCSFFLAWGLVSPIVSLADGVPEPQVPDHATFHFIYTNIIKTKCLNCHDPSDLNSDSSFDASGYAGAIQSVDTTSHIPENSFFYITTVPGGMMPMGCTGDDCLSQEESSSIYYWIKAGATDD